MEELVYKKWLCEGEATGKLAVYDVTLSHCWVIGGGHCFHTTAYQEYSCLHLFMGNYDRFFLKAAELRCLQRRIECDHMVYLILVILTWSGQQVWKMA